jgi:hypothetical protein
MAMGYAVQGDGAVYNAYSFEVGVSDYSQVISKFKSPHPSSSGLRAYLII